MQEKMAEVLLGGKRLAELKVTELKTELDKRGLPKKGVKSVLVQRLKNAILKEALTQVSISSFGHFENDPSLRQTILLTFLFYSQKCLKVEKMKETKAY